MTSVSSRVITCARCGATNHHAGRGLCCKCYDLLWKNGGLDRYPPTPRRREFWRLTEIDPNAIDETVVLRILGGDWRMKATPSDKAEVCRRWVRSGRPLNQLARLTGWATHRYYRVSEVS